MHVLTKIFTVLVALLAVMLVPLVVVYAHNEDSYKARAEAAAAQAAAARASLDAARASQSAQLQRKESEVGELSSANAALQREVEKQLGELRRLDTELTEARATDAGIQTQLATLVETLKNNQALTDTLIAEVRDLRRQALASEREKVELDAALREREAQLDAAVEARKAIQEELQRLKDDYAKAVNTNEAYAIRFGVLPDGAVAASEMSMVDKRLDAFVVNVRRSSDRTLAEIDAGSRDGVREGWTLTLAREGTFIGRLRIIEVDINRSTGIVEHEDAARGLVDVGDRAMAVPTR